MNKDKQKTEDSESQEGAGNNTQDNQPESFDREYVESLRAENAKYRTRAKEAAEAAAEATKAAERAKLDELELAKAEQADLKAALELERANRTSAERRAHLTGQVVDPVAALKLLDPEKHVKEDGSINLELFLTDFPYMQAASVEGVRIPGGRSKGSGPIDLKSMTAEEINSRWSEIHGK